MRRLPPEKGLLHRVFEASLLAKGALAAVETAAGIGFLLGPTDTLRHWAMSLAELDIVEDVSQPMAARMQRLIDDFAGPQQHFYAIYLLSHGIAKLALVGLLAARIRLAYPIGIVMQIGFIAYQMERWLHSHSAFMLGASILDLAIIWLIWREWQDAPPQAGTGTPR